MPSSPGTEPHHTQGEKSTGNQGVLELWVIIMITDCCLHRQCALGFFTLSDPI